MGTWLHVDGAYGLAALADPGDRGRCSAGSSVLTASSSTPTSGSLRPTTAARWSTGRRPKGLLAHGQSGAYLDTLDHAAWNPSDFALHLSRRARGLPLWFSLAVYGADAYAQAIRKTCEIAREIADGIAEDRRAGFDPWTRS